jgi:hypothetical protein
LRFTRAAKINPIVFSLFIGMEIIPMGKIMMELLGSVGKTIEPSIRQTASILLILPIQSLIMLHQEPGLEDIAMVQRH